MTMPKQYPVTHSEAEWRKLLTPEQYAIMREHGTEAPGSCALNFEKRHGTFSCTGCGQPACLLLPGTWRPWAWRSGRCASGRWHSGTVR
jgi:hypothetical protein